MKTLYILIGLKGSGKTFIGKLIEDKFSIPFIRVENIFNDIKRERHFSDSSYIKEGFILLEKEIRTRFEKENALTMESTGLTDEFKQMLERLRKDFSVKLIKIESSPGLCLRRVKERESKDHINVSDNDVDYINSQAIRVRYDYDLIIDNNAKLMQDILNEFSKILVEK